MFVIGALILSNAEVPVPMIIGLGLLSALLLIALIVRALKTRPRHTVSGDAGLVGSVTAVTTVQAKTPTTAGCICRVNTGKCTAPHPCTPGKRCAWCRARA
jgi:predicted branched-subunit amino acid permease